MRASTFLFQLQQQRIGFIGLGQMGSHMATNLLMKSTGLKSLTLFDKSSKALNQFMSKNNRNNNDNKCEIKIAETPKDVLLQSNIVVTMLPSSPHVREVYLSAEDGVLAGLRELKAKGNGNGAGKGLVLIDSSTIDPQTSKLVSSTLLREFEGLVCVDAPVSGGVGGAEAGTLTFMVGAQSENDLEAARPYLQLMGRNIVHCGQLGTGQVAKICNNMLLGISMLATSETMNLGMRLGMDPKVLSSIINTSSGRNWSSDTYNPVPGVMEKVPSSRDYTGGFAIELMTKDMQLAAQAAADSKSFNLIGAAAKELYQQCCKDEKLKGKDFSSVYQWMSRK